MRWTRLLLLIAILGILGGVGVSYYARLKEQNRDSPSRPKSLADGVTASSQGWDYTQTVNSRPTVSVHAADFEESGGKFHLKGVELHIFHKEGTVYDQVKSAEAEFNIQEGQLFSDGAVEITMGVPAGDQPAGRLMHIKSSGVTFDSKTGKAATDRAATFEFDMGNGSATGALYDPEIHELRMKSGVELLWRGRDAKAKPMHVQAGDLLYKEKEQKVWLGQWSKLQRDTMNMNAGPALVTLAKGLIQKVETEKATGVDQRPERKIEYGADKLTMDLDEKGQSIRKIVGEKNGRLVSETVAAVTTVTTDRIDLDFLIEDKESVLDTALATGHSVAESKPVLRKGVEPADTRILRSDVIKTKMREGGEEIDNVETASAGALEFIPNKAGGARRWMNGDKLWIKYGERNQIESFRSVNVATKTQKPKPADKKEIPPPALTWSQEMRADFDPKTGQLAKMEQWNAFRYEEGTRKAKADRATLEQARNLIHLTGGARVWDPTGSTDGDGIVMDQKSGDFTAEGNVNSTRMPEQKKKKKTAGPAGGGLLAEDEPLHAKARKMTSTDSNLLVKYEGNAVAWQSGNRLQADVIEIDRDEGIVKAHGKVVSQLRDKVEAPDPKAKPKSPAFTIVKAPEMMYTDDTKLAWYKGGVLLDRPNMRVKSDELRAFLRETDAEDEGGSSLDHAFADGKVEVVQTAPDRTRTGTSDHAEYYVDEAKVILEKGKPQLLDSVKGVTRGRKLTWFSDDDRLLVDGAQGDPAQSRLRRK